VDNNAHDLRDVAAARAGDHEAFARLYDRHAPVVLSLCRRAGGASEAEDALQETFVRAHRFLDRIRDPAGLRPWLYAIARRVCSERTRAAQRRRRHEVQAMLNTASPGMSGHAVAETAPIEVAQRAEALSRLGEALDQLDDRERLAIHLYYLESDPIPTALAALGLSRSGYYKLLGRARQRLGAIMQEVRIP
jgi:RNA polymerase sigma-70 factor (ECF subfamily)